MKPRAETETGSETLIDLPGPGKTLWDRGAETFGALVDLSHPSSLAQLVTKHGIRMGRGKPNLIAIPENDLNISRNHAWVVPLAMEQGRVVVMDLGSTNGTYVNGIRLDPAYRIDLVEGDVIQLGNRGEWRYEFRPVGTMDHRASLGQTS